MHRERAALPEIHVVQVQLEDLVLRRLPFEDERHELLEQLPAPGPLARGGLAGECLGEEEVPRELLGERAGTLEVSALAAQVRDERARHPHRIDPWMIVETAVLDGEDRLHHAWRYRRERHLPALLAAGAHEGGEQRGIEGDAVGSRPPASIPLTRPGVVAAPTALRTRGCSKRMRTVWPLTVAAAGDDRNRPGTDGELASLLDARPLGISQIVQPIDDLCRAERLTLPQLERACEYPRQHPLPLSMKPRLNLPGEDYVVVAETQPQQDGRDGDCEREVLDPAAPPLSRSGSPAGRSSRGGCCQWLQSAD